MANLYLMCGCPGSGKSTFLKTKINVNCNYTVVSRDEIRFSMLSENDAYFSHEDEVKKKFWKTINENLKNGKDVFADQTSLTPRSRKYFLDHVWGYDQVNVIWIDEPLETCINRNEQRKGTQAYVPQSQLCRMFHSFVKPSLDEGFNKIFHYSSADDRIAYLYGGGKQNE